MHPSAAAGSCRSVYAALTHPFCSHNRRLKCVTTLPCDIPRISWISPILRCGFAFTKVVIMSVFTVRERPNRSASLTLKFSTRKRANHFRNTRSFRPVFTNPTIRFCSVESFMEVITHYMAIMLSDNVLSSA